MSMKPAFFALTTLAAVTAFAIVNPLDHSASSSPFSFSSQTEAAPKPTPPQSSAPAPAAPAAAARPNAAAPQVDETALRYFAAQGDEARLQAEIARLRALYPNWTPPANLNEPANVTDAELDQIWKLYADGKYGEARAAVAARRAKDSAWTPPPDLVARLDEAEARERLGNAAASGQWGSVLNIAEETPGLLTCGDVATMWQVAEAFAKTRRPDRARDAFDYVLANCNDPAERLGTIQRAATVVDAAAVATLLKRERNNEFAAFREDQLRERMNAAAEDPKATVVPEDVAAMGSLARDGDRASDALTMGWYALNRGQAADALTWFELSRKREETPKAVEGLVLAMAQTGRAVEAEPLANEWRTRADGNRAAYLNVVTTALAANPPPRLAPDVLSRMTAAIVEARSAAAGQAIGFYALNIRQVPTAARWFTTALGWNPNDEPSAYGLALARQRLGDRAAFIAMLRDWGPRSPRIAALANPPAVRAAAGAPVPLVPAPARSTAQADAAVVQEPAYATPLMDTALPLVSKSEPQQQSLADWSDEPARAAPVRRQPAASSAAPRTGGSCGRGAALDRGWCLMEINRPVEAIAAFDEALSTGSGPTRETAAYGKSLAQIRLGLTDDAAVSATQAPMSARRGTELQVAILTQRALSAYRANRFSETIIALQERNQLAPDQTDLMMIRGWSYYRLRRFDDARLLFEAVARSGNTEGHRGLTAIGEVTRRIRGY